MSEQETLDRFNRHALTFITMLGGKMTAIGQAQQSCTFEFNITTDFCHSIDMVQGGFITAMLDAAMSHAAFSHIANVTGVSSLEIKTSYLEPTRAGRLRAVGSIVKSGYKIAFMEAQLYNDQDVLLATSSSVAKLTRNS